MQWDPQFKPRLRPLETVPLSGEENGYIGLRDASGLTDVLLTVSPAALFMMARMDGSSTCDNIRNSFEKEAGHPLAVDDFLALLNRLEQCHLLHGPAFEAFFDDLQQDYRSQPARSCGDQSALAILNGTDTLLGEMLDGVKTQPVGGRVAGLVAPHLDYPRGRTCYAHAYASLEGQPVPQRVIILGTNHFGRSTSVVATGVDFETPLGRVAVDRAFIDELERECGSLRQYELDHRREHSIELQVAWLQYMFGASSFSIVPLLCPDPCGPTGTAPRDGNGVDLGAFAVILGEAIEGNDTLLVAGADLSHVGASFGDDRQLDDQYLQEVEHHDRHALRKLVEEGGDAMAEYLKSGKNHTSICSAGCLFTLATALGSVKAQLLHYHQAVDQATQTCVTCAALVYCEPK